MKKLLIVYEHFETFFTLASNRLRETLKLSFGFKTIISLGKTLSQYCSSRKPQGLLFLSIIHIQIHTHLEWGGCE
jgi:hypothetical protein